MPSFAEGAPQVVLDGLRAEEQSCTISGLEKPAPASRAIWASWAVRSSRVSTVPLTGALASRQELTRDPLGEGRTRPDDHLAGGASLVARVEAPAPATQPFAEQQMGAATHGADATAAEPATPSP